MYRLHVLSPSCPKGFASSRRPRVLLPHDSPNSHYNHRNKHTCAKHYQMNMTTSTARRRRRSFFVLRLSGGQPEKAVVIKWRAVFLGLVLRWDLFPYCITFLHRNRVFFLFPFFRLKDILIISLQNPHTITPKISPKPEERT